MPNTIITSTLVAKEALALLRQKAVLANLVRRDMDVNFVAGRGDTVNVRKRGSLKAPAFTGTAVTQNLSETAVPVKLNVIRSVDIPVTAKEMTLDIADFSSQVLEPALAAISESIDADIFAAVVEAGFAAVESQSSPAAITDIGKLSKDLDINKVDRANRYLVLSTQHKYDYLSTDNLIKAAYAGDSKALREADLGMLYGMYSFMDTNAVDGTAVGTAGTATSYKVTGTAGATTVALSSLSAATATVAEGEGFIYKGIFYRFTAGGTGVSNAIASIGIDQPLNEALTTADVKVIKKDYSIAFQKECVCLAVRPLEKPVTGEGEVISYDGFSVRVTYGYDQDTKTNKFSVDVLYGVKVLESKGVAVLG